MSVSQSSPVVRPLSGEYRRNLLFIAPAALIGLICMLTVLAVGTHTGGGMGWLAVPAVAAIAAPVLFFMIWLELRVRVETLIAVDGAFVWTNWVGRRRVLKNPASARTYLIGFNSDPVIVVASADHQRPLVLSGRRWPALDVVWEPLGLEHEDFGKVDPGALRRANPGARIPFAIAYPAIGVGAVVGGLLYIGLVINVFHRL